jgi:hypothetical protein
MGCPEAGLVEFIWLETVRVLAHPEWVEWTVSGRTMPNLLLHAVHAPHALCSYGFYPARSFGDVVAEA